MAVEITGLPPAVTHGKGNNTAENTAHGNVTQEKTPASTDVVTLTSQATNIKALETDIGKQSAVDGNRVETLKAAIDAGSYVIDPSRVAEKFIEFEFSLSA